MYVCIKISCRCSYTFGFICVVLMVSLESCFGSMQSEMGKCNQCSICQKSHIIVWYYLRCPVDSSHPTWLETTMLTFGFVDFSIKMFFPKLPNSKFPKASKLKDNSKSWQPKWHNKHSSFPKKPGPQFFSVVRWAGFRCVDCIQLQWFLAMHFQEIYTTEITRLQYINIYNK